MPREAGVFSTVGVLVRFWSCTMPFYKMVLLDM
jgi:hypothetical protein